VKSYAISTNTAVEAGEDIVAISSSDSEETTDTTETETSENQGMERPDMQEQAGEGAQQLNSDFQISGVLDTSTMSTFTDGTATLVSGTAITEEDQDKKVALIEQTLAEANDLKVGDTFHIIDSNENSVELTIRGIYETSENGSEMGQMFNFMNPANTIYSSYTL